MKVYSFRIKNYKSIKDSGKCYVDNKITIFAGKNGSGKSNILEALNKFSNQNFDFEEDNYNYGKDNPNIVVEYKLNVLEIENIKRLFKVKINEIFSIELDAKESKGNPYHVEFSSTFQDVKKSNKEVVNKLKKKYPDMNYILGDTIDDVLEEIKNSGIDITTISEELTKNGFVDIDTIKDQIDTYLINNIPDFIYQKTIENELKSIISSESIKTNDFHKDIAKLMEFNSDDFNSAKDKSWRSRRGNSFSKELTGDFGEFYTQDKIELNFTLDGNEIVMDVIEPEKASNSENKIENKSDGLKWFIAFYAKLNVTKNKKVIILLDEPGMYLHAKACKEMLKIFDTISNESQIFLVTHNPYLIDPNKLNYIRLVLNDKELSTIIENKPYKYNQDVYMDTITPILTSIGYELTTSIHVGDQKNNLIVEGISDYYYIQGMAKYLEIDLNYHIIPASGADKIIYIASILFGWGLNTVVLFDNDKKGKTKTAEMKQLINSVVFVSETNDYSIEDLFSSEDYKKKILELDTISSEPNSKVKKNKNIDEILKARQFFEKVDSNNIKLSAQSENSFRELFKRIDETFKDIR